MEINKLRTDAKAAVGGAWIADIDGFEDFRVRTKSMNCPQAERYSTELYNQILGRRVRRKDKTVPPEIREYVHAKTLIDVCILEWENWHEQKVDAAGNVVLENGAPVIIEVPYSRAHLAKTLLIEAPAGVAATKPNGRTQIHRTPDKMAFNFEMKRLLDGLIDAALRVDAPDDEDDENEDGEEGQPEEQSEKNSSKPGSAGDTATAGA